MQERIRPHYLSAFLLALALPISVFAQVEKKSAYAILIDNTGSLRTQFSQVKAFGKGVVARIYQRGPVSLFNFKTQGSKTNSLAVVTSGIEWSEDISVLENYIDTLKVQPGQTTLMDAIYSVADSLNSKVNMGSNAFSEKVIILITDGEDRVSKVKEKQLVKQLHDCGVTVYAVGLVQELDREAGLIRRSTRPQAEEFLKRLTKETGGRVKFPKSNEQNVAGLLNELFAK
jgi:uncharacterized protein YegL